MKGNYDVLLVHTFRFFIGSTLSNLTSFSCFKYWNNFHIQSEQYIDEKLLKYQDIKQTHTPDNQCSYHDTSQKFLFSANKNSKSILYPILILPEILSQILSLQL